METKLACELASTPLYELGPQTTTYEDFGAFRAKSLRIIGRRAVRFARMGAPKSS